MHSHVGSSTLHVSPSEAGLLAQVRASSRTVLIVDDDYLVRDLLRNILVAEGLDVLTAADGRSCVEASLLSQPDLVLLDVRLPSMDGFEACRRIKAATQSRFLPVIMISGLSDVQDRLLSIQAGADDFLTKPIDRHQLVARVKSLLVLKSKIDELEAAEAILLTLARTIEAKDPYIEGHCERLAELSSRLGRRMGLPSEQVAALWRAGIVHDIGKVAVPDAILFKPGMLTPYERLQMQQHSVVGEEICRPLKSFRAVLPIIRHHHEKLDGSGYPDGLKGNEIPLAARVLQIVDVYDALRMPRPYKEAMSQAKALQLMRQEVARGWWDAPVFETFQQMLYCAADSASPSFETDVEQD